MSLELTARLTLNSCVSQLTNFYDTDISPLLLEDGFQATTINLCDLSGECYGYTIRLTPICLGGEDSRNLMSLIAGVYIPSALDGGETIVAFTTSIMKQGMRIREVYQCALHCCGDFIKFYSRGK